MSVSLSKGQRVSLSKDDGSAILKMCVGVNWGAILKKGFFGGTKKEAVDLDASCAAFGKNGELLEVIYFGNLSGTGIAHSGDDLTGDLDGDDGLDNEVILVDLTKVSSDVEQIIFVLNSFQGHDFKTIPFASIRLYEGTPSKVNKIFAQFDIANDMKFSGAVSMVLGKLYRNSGQWKFTAIGDTTRDKDLKQTIQTVSQNYL